MINELIQGLEVSPEEKQKLLEAYQIEIDRVSEKFTSMHEKQLQEVKEIHQKNMQSSTLVDENLRAENERLKSQMELNEALNRELSRHNLAPETKEFIKENVHNEFVAKGYKNQGGHFIQSANGFPVKGINTVADLVIKHKQALGATSTQSKGGNQEFTKDERWVSTSEWDESKGFRRSVLSFDEIIG